MNEMKTTITWIPIDEELPSISTNVLVTIRCIRLGSNGRKHYKYYTSVAAYNPITGWQYINLVTDEITAWAPFPMPYSPLY